MSAPDWLGTCPVTIAPDAACITLAHGEGARASRQLLAERILPILGNRTLDRLADAAVLPGSNPANLAFTTDSFVVSPLFFPGGDIGKLAVCGTVNDLVVSGAVPRWISLSLILEEGLPLAVLDCILHSIAAACAETGVAVVTGDTKVVPRGAADGVFINTAGIGEVLAPAPAGPQALQDGDEILVTGPIGRHGIAILACREQLGLVPAPRSDCAPLCAFAHALREQGVPVRALRDATRGGVAAVLHEWAGACALTCLVDEGHIPVDPVVRSACELLGLNPLHLANEGTMVVAVPKGRGPHAIEALRSVPGGEHAAVIGRWLPRGIAPVTVLRGLGRQVALDEPHGTPLPRIC